MNDYGSVCVHLHVSASPPRTGSGEHVSEGRVGVNFMTTDLADCGLEGLSVRGSRGSGKLNFAVLLHGTGVVVCKPTSAVLFSRLCSVTYVCAYNDMIHIYIYIYILYVYIYICIYIYTHTCLFMFAYFIHTSPFCSKIWSALQDKKG